MGDISSGEPNINRWIIVVGAILIQLCLGAIYAWAVFTTPLVEPLPDNTFTDIADDNGISVIVQGGLVAGEEQTITLFFMEDDEEIATFSNVSVVLELRDEEGNIVHDDKILPLVGTVYKKGDPIIHEPETIVVQDNGYVFDAKVKEKGNWHYMITVRNETDKYSFDVIEHVSTGDFGFSKTQTQMIFSAGLFFFALFTIIGGRLSKRFGPRNMAIAGGAVLGSGYILASFMGTSFIGLLFSIGVLGGIGIGLAYVVPIAVGVKWFPDKKGLISGLAVAGFGFGALLWIKLATGFEFGPVNLTPGWDGLFGDGLSVSTVFRIYGVTFAAAVIGGGFLMINPPDGWLPKGWAPPEATDKTATGSVEFTSEEMIKTPQYWMLFLMFMIGAGAGLMVIGVIKLFGVDALEGSGTSAEEASVIAGTAMALFYSLANGIGRIAWGAISDKITRRWSFVIMFTIQGVMMLLFYFIGGNEYLLYIGAALVGFNFGGNFALFPSATADFFGNKSVGLNYGFVFFSYGIGGIIGPILGGVMGDLNLWIWAFIPAGIACLIAAAIGFMLKPPRAKE